jgi:hypothetical protein
MNKGHQQTSLAQASDNERMHKGPRRPKTLILNFMVLGCALAQDAKKHAFKATRTSLAYLASNRWTRSAVISHFVWYLIVHSSIFHARALGQMGLDPWNAMFGHDRHGFLFVGQEPLAVDAWPIDVGCGGHHLWLPHQKLETLSKCRSIGDWVLAWALL